MKFEKQTIGILIILIFHLVGIVGLLSPYRELMIALTPVHLLVCSVVLIWTHQDKKSSFFVALTLIFTIGFILEWVGVVTGFPFGDYYYGNGLGLKIQEIPLMIGVNWMLLIYSLSCILSKINLPIYLNALLGAILMVVLDMLIEQVASVLDYWYWSDDVIPATNYWGWFGYSFLLLIVFQLFSFSKTNKVAVYFFVFQAVFFVILNVFI